MKKNNQKLKGLTKAILIVAIVIIVAMLVLINKSEKNQYNSFSQTQKDSISRKEITDKAYDKIEPNVIASVKSSMNNPKSFEYVKAGYFDLGNDTLLVKLTYRGTNAFNAVVTETATASALLDGTVVKVVSE